MLYLFCSTIVGDNLCCVAFCMHIFENAVIEVKNATCDIHDSLTEQKQMLDLSAQQHEEVAVSLLYLI